MGREDGRTINVGLVSFHVLTKREAHLEAIIQNAEAETDGLYELISSGAVSPATERRISETENKEHNHPRSSIGISVLGHPLVNVFVAPHAR